MVELSGTPVRQEAKGGQSRGRVAGRLPQQALRASYAEVAAALALRLLARLAAPTDSSAAGRALPRVPASPQPAGELTSHARASQPTPRGPREAAVAGAAAVGAVRAMIGRA